MPDFTGFTPEPIEEIIRDCGYGKKKGGGEGGVKGFKIRIFLEKFKG